VTIRSHIVTPVTEPTAPIFRALADPNRRVLLDRLFERDGQTLGELCEHLPDMTRFGVMKHLGILEDAELVTTVRSGREKRHFLNPVPIRLVHDRWISKFAEPVVGAMSAIKAQLESPMDTIDHVYSVYIKAAPDRVWRAITDGNETVRYYFGTRVESAWEAGSPLSYAYPDGSIAADGSVVDIEPGRRVVMLFHPRWDAGIEADGPIRMTWEVEEAEDGGAKLTVTSALKPGSKAAEEFSGGIVYIVSGLKTFIETGEPLTVR
jgi:DNA-binding transcriptional ArsR family regulator